MITVSKFGKKIQIMDYYALKNAFFFDFQLENK